MTLKKPLKLKKTIQNVSWMMKHIQASLMRAPAAACSNEYREGASSSEDDSHFDCTVCIDDVRTSVGESVEILILFGN